MSFIISLEDFYMKVALSLKFLVDFLRKRAKLCVSVNGGHFWASYQGKRIAVSETYVWEIYGMEMDGLYILTYKPPQMIYVKQWLIWLWSNIIGNNSHAK